MRGPAEPDWPMARVALRGSLHSAEGSTPATFRRTPWLLIRGLIFNDGWKGYIEKKTLGISEKVARERIYLSSILPTVGFQLRFHTPLLTTPYINMPDQLITSSSPHGCVIAMNMWVHPDKVPEVLDNMRLVLEKLKADPNCLYIDTCQNPQDPSHLRFVHGWKKDSKYFYEVR
jgi:hypothetical protein